MLYLIRSAIVIVCGGRIILTRGHTCVSAPVHASATSRKTRCSFTPDVSSETLARAGPRALSCASEAHAPYPPAPNALRKLTHGKLGEIIHGHAELPGDFADRFFLTNGGSRAPTISELSQTVERSRAKLKRQEAQLEALKEKGRFASKSASRNGTCRTLSSPRCSTKTSCRSSCGSGEAASRNGSGFVGLIGLKGGGFASPPVNPVQGWHIFGLLPTHFPLTHSLPELHG